MIQSRNLQQGFTIVELMIATTVFSFVLLVASAGVISIGRMYYKGVTTAKTQEAARGIIEDVSRARQYTGGNMSSGGPSTSGLRSFCFGQDRYTYRLDNTVTNPDANNSGTWAIRHDINPDIGSCEPLESGGNELLDKNMKLVKFTVNSLTAGQFGVEVKVVYGENDLQEITQCSGIRVDNICQNPSDEDIATTRCRSGVAGSSFCAVSELATVVDKRIE